MTSHFRIVVALYVSSSFLWASSVTVRSFDVNGIAQADAHLIEFSDTKKTRFLVDVGNENTMLLDRLKARGILAIDKVLISHSHKDHYAGLKNLIEGGIRIGEVRWNFAPKKICDNEVPWGCDWNHLEATKKLLGSRKIPVRGQKIGDVYFNFKGARLEVIQANDGIHTPIGEVDVNDMSVLLRLSVGPTRMLFTGDLNRKIGEYLAKNRSSQLRADILKLPHHGASTHPPPEFFDAVSFRLGIVPISPNIWNTDRCKEAKEYLIKKKIPFLVTGVHGDVEVTLENSGFKVRPEPR